jgi:hypothetical protein
MNKFSLRFNTSILLTPQRRGLFSSIGLLLSWFMLQLVSAAATYGFDASADTWALLDGYGQSLPGLNRSS